MHFTISYPENDETIEMVMDGNQDFFDFDHMSKKPKPIAWMPNKYGKQKDPWECHHPVPNTQGNNCGQFTLDAEVTHLEYNYHII